MFRSCVYLVGAGPGSCDLITLRGLSVLRSADCILYDDLIDERLLDAAPKEAERIDVGKRSGRSALSQDEICELLAVKAKQYSRVVRLKGGDPFIFGRGGEEAEFLAARSIAFEVVPGVTAAVAAGDFAGIPLTDRKLASSVTFVTGHRAEGKSAVDWTKLAQAGDTLVIYMGVETIEDAARQLCAGGRGAEEPAAFVESAATPRQRTIVGTLGDIALKIRQAEGHSPAILIVGRVVDLRMSLAWVERRPLWGKRFLILRPQAQAASLSLPLEELGAAVVTSPTVKIDPLENWEAVDKLIAQLAAFDWLVFTSANGVAYFFQRLRDLGKDARSLAGVRLAVIGPATAEELKTRGLNADCVAEPHTSAGLMRALESAGPIRGRKFALARSSRATRELVEGLIAKGAEVTELTIYRASPLKLASAAREAVLAGNIDAAIFTSADTFENFLSSFDAQERRAIERLEIISIGPITSRAIKRAGFKVGCEAASHTTEGLVCALLKHYESAS